MNIIKYIRNLTLTLVGLVTVQVVAFAETSAKPNIVFILADDLRPDCLGILGHPIVKTPNIDKLMENGVIFRQTYIVGSDAGAVCMPSRTMIQTGRTYFNKKGPTPPTFAQTMMGAGYAGIRSGKFSNNPNKLDEVLDVHLDGGNAQGNANNIISFIGKNAGKKPLFLYMATYEPHDPQFATAEFYAMYDAKKIPMPVNLLPYHPFDNGDMTVRDEMTLSWPRTAENVGGKLARYYASISYWDSQVGRVVDALKKAGQFENTFFVVAGDNGLSLGEHGLLGKQNVYHFGGMHVPLIIAGPGIRKGETNAFAHLFDVYPTVCDLAGIPIPEGLDAKSLKPILDGKVAKIRDAIFTSYKDCQRSVRTDRWHLIRYPLINKTQLFDIQADPHEMNNLADNPEYEAKVKELMDLIRKNQEACGDEDPLFVENPVSGEWTPEKGAAQASERRDAKKTGKKK